MQKKRTLRRAAALTLSALLAATSLTACGGTGNTSSESTDNSATVESAAAESGSDEKISITFWTTQRHDLDFMEEKVAEFNATNTMNIEVTYEAMADNYDNNLELAFQSNQAPDIFRPKSEIVPYVKKGMAIPIDEFLTDEDRERYGDTLGIQNINVYEAKPTASRPTATTTG